MLAVSVVKDLSLLTADVSVAFMDTSVEAEAGDYVASSEHVYQWMQSDCAAMNGFFVRARCVSAGLCENTRAAWQLFFTART